MTIITAEINELCEQVIGQLLEENFKDGYKKFLCHLNQNSIFKDEKEIYTFDTLKNFLSLLKTLCNEYNELIFIENYILFKNFNIVKDISYFGSLQFIELMDKLENQYMQFILDSLTNH